MCQILVRFFSVDDFVMSSVGSEISTDDRSFLMLKLCSMDVTSTQVFFYPRLIPMVRFLRERIHLQVDV